MSAPWLPERFRRPVPWRVGDVLALVGTGGAGLVVVVVAAFGADQSGSLGRQVIWLNVGIAGVIALGVGNLLWLITCRRAIGELRRTLLPHVRTVLTDAGARSAEPAGDRWVAGASMTRFHRPGCAFVAGKPVRVASEATHRRQGRRPCDLCAAREASGG